MEFNVFEYFKGYQRTTSGPMTPEEQGTSVLSRRPHGRADRRARGRLCRQGRTVAAGLPRHRIGLRGRHAGREQDHGHAFFEVTRGRGVRPGRGQGDHGHAEAGCRLHRRRPHPHLHARKDGYIPGVNTTEKGMWFVQLLDDLGKAMGLPNGTKDMTVENFGKLILEGSDTSIADLQPVRLPRGLRRQGHDPDRGAGRGQAALARSHRHAGRRADAQPGSRARRWSACSMFVEHYKISGLKLYTFDSTPKRGWWFDDQKLAYPDLGASAGSSGVKNIGCHKGIPFGQFMARYAHRRGLRRGGRRLPRSELHRLPLGLALPRTSWRRSKGFKPQRNEPLLRGWLDLRRDRDEPAARVRARARHAPARPRAGLRHVGDGLRSCGGTRSGRSTRSGSSRSPTSWSRATATRS